MGSAAGRVHRGRATATPLPGAAARTGPPAVIAWRISVVGTAQDRAHAPPRPSGLAAAPDRRRPQTGRYAGFRREPRIYIQKLSGGDVFSLALGLPCDGGIGRVLGLTAIMQRRRDCRNADLAVAAVEIRAFLRRLVLVGAGRHQFLSHSLDVGRSDNEQVRQIWAANRSLL